MSDVKVVRYLLANNAPLVAVVPAEKIQPGVIPQGTVLPAIAISHVSTVRRKTVDRGATEYCTARVQVTVQSKSYAEQKRTLRLVRDALPRTRGTVHGVEVDNILHDIDGPDFNDSDTEIYMGSSDFIVTFHE
jgi:hypothetical protein